MADGKKSGTRRHNDETASPLTPRELECLALVADGLHDADIVKRLDISKSTIAMHITNARRKLGAATREQAVACALRRGLMK